MLWFRFSIKGLLLLFLGNILHCFFILTLKNRNSSNSSTTSNPLQIAKILFLFLISSFIYILASIYVEPSTFGVSLAYLMIFYDIYHFYYKKRSPYFKRLYEPSLFVSIFAIIVNFLHSPPSFENIGLFEVYHLLYSPVGSVLTVAYTLIQLILFILVRKNNHLGILLNLSFVMCSYENFLKLTSNCILLSITIENQVFTPFFVPFFIAFIVTCIYYVYSLLQFFKLEINGLQRGVGYFAYLVVQVASATLLYGDPMLLPPIPVALFLSSAVLLALSVLAMSIGAWSFSSNQTLP